VKPTAGGRHACSASRAHRCLVPLLRRGLPASVRRLLAASLPVSLFRASTIKLKINGRCVNHCVFCLFHDDPSLLEVADLEAFFNAIEGHRVRTIVINGGEPTIHPRFLDICAFLSDRFKGKAQLVLGTNLLTLGESSERRRLVVRTIFETYDHLQVGCDDEHRNVAALERWAPRIVNEGLTLTVNILRDYCGAETWERIHAACVLPGVDVTVSELHHVYDGRTVRNRPTRPCRRRLRDLLLNCNGDAFFCFLQEFEEPLFNLFTAGPERIRHRLRAGSLPLFKYCAVCPVYQPETLVQDLTERAAMLGRRVRGRRWATELPEPASRPARRDSLTETHS